MFTHIKLKNSLLMLLGGFICAIITAYFINFLLSGPKLGRHYDFLADYKTKTVSREIFIIDTGEYIESSDLYTVLLALTEMQANKLILTGRISPASSPITITESDIRRRFLDEYNVLGSNIRNLFEGIRMGFVSPVQAPLFVDQVVELAEQGRDRLVSALIDRDEDLLRYVAMFGNYLQVDTRPQLDRDGILRRVKPVDENEEHPVYQYLKNRYAVSQIESSDQRQFLWLRDHNARSFDIPLDKNANIIAIGNSAFRRTGIEELRRYEELKNAMYNALIKANELRAFSQTPPDRIPLFLGEHTQHLLEELLNTPDSENRLAWISSRANYLNSLEEYFNSDAEAVLLNIIEEQILDTDPDYNEEQLNNLLARKDEIKNIFVQMHEIYKEYSALYTRLKNNISLSLCFMGPLPNTDYSALLANVLITGSHIKPVYDRYIVFWTTIAVFIVLITILALKPVILLPAGILLSVLAALVFSGFFILYSYWIDPLIVLGSCITGTIFIFISKCLYLNYRARSFRMAYRSSVSKDALRGLIKAGKPALSKTSSGFASVIAIKDFNLLGKEDNEKLQDAGRARRVFYTMVKKAVFNAGAAIAGFEGDTILVCFGSPLELNPTLLTYKWADDGRPLAKTYHPVEKAYAFVKQLLKNEKISWRFSIDAGECYFYWSPETGFTVNGKPAVRARILVSKTARFQARALVSNTVLDKIETHTQTVQEGNESYYIIA
jgi:hypothetical protein